MGGNGFRASEVRLEVLDEAFPVSKIERILEELNRQSVRVRKLPATMMVYYVCPASTRTAGSRQLETAGSVAGFRQSPDRSGPAVDDGG